MPLLIHKTRSMRTSFSRKAQVELMRNRVTKYGETATYWTLAAWEATLKHFDYCCAYCGQKETHERHTHLVMDHFFPASQAGKTKLGNIVPACSRCNGSKSDKLPWQWMGANKASVLDGRLEQLCAIHRIKRGEPTEQPY